MATQRQKNQDDKVIIAGAGIAGLTAALALAKHGFSVLILEKSDRLEEVGAGLQLSPNATSVLCALDVLNDLLLQATIVNSIDLFSARIGNPLLCLDIEASARDSAPYLALHRTDLQQALLLQTQKNPLIELRLNANVISRQLNGSSVTVQFETAGRSHSEVGLCLIGADGVRSALRLSGSATPAQFSGYVAHRLTVERKALRSEALAAIDRVRAFIAPNAHLVAYPISKGSRINLVQINRHKSLSAAAAQPNPSFAGFAPHLLQDLAPLQNWTSWPLFTVDVATPWRLDDRTMLIGDAAHAMLPFGAQGAAMAIEDAWTLAHCLAQNRDRITTGFAIYEQHRRKRVAQVDARSRLNAFAYHTAGPIALARNLVFATKGQRLMRDLDWLYEYRVPGL